jgi:hypothetical protein
VALGPEARLRRARNDAFVTQVVVTTTLASMATLALLIALIR